MTETANSLIGDALGEAFINAQEQPTEAVDMQKGIRYLNRMMASLSSQGIALGYTVVSDPTDAITVADGAIEGLVFNLAMKLAPSYGEPVSADLRDNAKIGKQAILDIAVFTEPTRPPCTLPIGSGNEGQNGSTFGVDRFFPCDEDVITTEERRNITLESGT